ncbi:hypothetical protein [Flavobacterium faecale]|uniref:hypothetical protein n=1 Tax=Flavobacterium faecale TaxID=1355330 RepID=UPI003AADB69F
MKKIITTALIAIISITGYAQEKQERHGKHEGQPMEQFTPEQRQELMLKKMTLELDLTTSQQKDMSKIIGEQSAKREAQMKNRKAKTEKPTSDEIFAMKSKMLDEQIAMKAKMKKILSPEQFTKWEKLKDHHHKGMQRHHSKGDKKRMMREGEMKK